MRGNDEFRNRQIETSVIGLGLGYAAMIGGAVLVLLALTILGDPQPAGTGWTGLLVGLP